MTLVALPEPSTRTTGAPIVVHQDVERGEHLVRIDIPEHELRRLVLIVVMRGGMADLAPLAHMIETLRGRQQKKQPIDVQLHDDIDAALTRVLSRVVSHGGGTWHIDPDVAEEIEHQLSDAAEEPAICPDCRQVFIAPEQTYCGPCDDAHTHPRSA